MRIRCESERYVQYELILAAYAHYECTYAARTKNKDRRMRSLFVVLAVYAHEWCAYAARMSDTRSVRAHKYAHVRTLRTFAAYVRVSCVRTRTYTAQRTYAYECSLREHTYVYVRNATYVHVRTQRTCTYDANVRSIRTSTCWSFTRSVSAAQRTIKYSGSRRTYLCVQICSASYDRSEE